MGRKRNAAYCIYMEILRSWRTSTGFEH
jgi:hypothetical protein